MRVLLVGSELVSGFRVVDGVRVLIVGSELVSGVRVLLVG